MAVCCICNKKLGRHATVYVFSAKYSQLALCEECYMNKQNLQVSTEGEIEKIQKSRLYFEDYLSIGMVAASATEPLKEALKEAEAAEKESLRYRRRNKSFPATTGNSFEGYRIVSYLDVVSGEVVLNTGALTELGTQICDISGKTNDIVAHKLNMAKEEALERLKQKAVMEGANAVLGVAYEISMLMESMIVISVSGTAVLAEKQSNMK